MGANFSIFEHPPPPAVVSRAAAIAPTLWFLLAVSAYDGKGTPTIWPDCEWHPPGLRTGMTEICFSSMRNWRSLGACIGIGVVLACAAMPGHAAAGDDITALKTKAEHGDPIAQFSLGMLYSQGPSALRDDVQAAKWFRKAAEHGYQGSAEAQFMLGLMYRAGQGVPKNHIEAAKWFRVAAQQGNPNAQYELGTIYRKGQGVLMDNTEAVKWFRKAAEQGKSEAEFMLGFMYLGGQGVPRDETEAAKWYRKAAEHGFAKAQLEIGFSYLDGRGVPKDASEGVKWVRKAAEQGYAPAQLHFGFMYDYGSVYCRTILKRSSGIAKPLSRGTESLNPGSVPCTTKPKAYRRTLKRRIFGRLSLQIPANGWLRALSRLSTG